ncbi:hypothetical protein [Mycoplasmopsis felis]|uniref:hypothetical protein n=1 Tax=Mycoplasmopsis felis TaxID=33923 RepID=UPI002FF32E79
MDDIHENLYNSAKQRLDNNTVFVTDYEEFKKEINNGKFVYSPFCCLDYAEERIKEETGKIIWDVFQ